MARMHVMERSEAQSVMDSLHEMLGKRLAVSSLAPCPVEFTSAYINMCATQSCGKCTPCRVGLSVLRDLFDDVLENRATPETLEQIEKVARTIYLSADCAIGYEAGEMALTAIMGFKDDFEHHVNKHACGFDQNAPVPCVAGCPAGVDIPGYISLVEAKRYTDAIKLIRKDNPLPLVCGIVCEHPCEMYCRRGMVDNPMNIRGIKRYAAEHMESDYRPTIAKATGKKVAVIGGGPAGLSAAYYLTLMGHKVTIFEQRAQLGGMLRYGIPSYRLPREKLDSEIQWILDCGIDVNLNCRIDDNLEELRKEYDAVYLAIGAHSDKKLGLENEDAMGVSSAVEMLRAIGDGDFPDFSGERVVVVGGGNVAMDVARSAARLGATHVTVVYRRRIADMTAQDEEIVGAQAEGVEILELHAPVGITIENGRAKGLKVQKQIIGQFRGGRPAPHVADEPVRTVKASRIIVAIGQDIDSEPFEQYGIKNKRGRIIAEPDGTIAGVEGVFSGGDCQSGPATVIRAINAGKVAAGNIDNYLGFHHEIVQEVELPPVQFKGKISCARCETRVRRSDQRVQDFEDIEISLTEEEVSQEASRCLRCDHFGFGGFRGGRTERW